MECSILLRLFAVVVFPIVASRPTKLPVCTSHSKLCDITLEVKQHGFPPGNNVLYKSGPMCACPGKVTCPTSINDTSRVYYQEITSSDQTVFTRLSYCDAKAVPSRSCENNEVAVTLRGYGPVLTEIAGDVKCRCSGSLDLHKAYPDGFLSNREYACGKEVCNVNRSIPPVCERVINILTTSGFGLMSEITCKCPIGFYCNTQGSRSPADVSGEPTEYRCEPVSFY